MEFASVWYRAGRGDILAISLVRRNVSSLTLSEVGAGALIGPPTARRSGGAGPRRLSPPHACTCSWCAVVREWCGGGGKCSGAVLTARGARAGREGTRRRGPQTSSKGKRTRSLL